MISPCAHPVSVTCIRTIGGGGTQIVKQCQTCGVATSSAMSRAKFTPAQIAAMPGFVESAAADYDQRMREANQLAWDMGKQDRQHEYALYLESPEWKERRRLTLERDKYKCQGCQRAPATEVHHLSYKNRGDELLYQLTSLCRECHAKVHATENGLRAATQP